MSWDIIESTGDACRLKPSICNPEYTQTRWQYLCNEYPDYEHKISAHGKNAGFDCGGGVTLGKDMIVTAHMEDGRTFDWWAWQQDALKSEISKRLPPPNSGFIRISSWPGVLLFLSSRDVFCVLSKMMQRSKLYI